MLDFTREFKNSMETYTHISYLPISALHCRVETRRIPNQQGIYYSMYKRAFRFWLMKVIHKHDKN